MTYKYQEKITHPTIYLPQGITPVRAGDKEPIYLDADDEKLIIRDKRGNTIGSVSREEVKPVG